MQKYLLLSSLLLAIVLAVAGCGGGSGAGAPVQSAEIELTVPDGAAPVGVTPTVTPETSADLPTLSGPAFVAAADCTPHGTVFSQPVTFTFTLSIALGASEQVDLFQSDALGNWTQVPGSVVTISASRTTVTVSNISQFSSNGHYALLIVG